MDRRPLYWGSAPIPLQDVLPPSQVPTSSTTMLDSDAESIESRMDREKFRNKQRQKEKLRQQQVQRLTVERKCFRSIKFSSLAALQIVILKTSSAASKEKLSSKLWHSHFQYDLAMPSWNGNQSQHMEASTKWSPFCRRHFQTHRKLSCFD